MSRKLKPIQDPLVLRFEITRLKQHIAVLLWQRNQLLELVKGVQEGLSGADYQEAKRLISEIK